MTKKKLLFVCLGNICRSPSAEAVMNDYIKKNNLNHKIECDSAGTAAYHTGEKADARMRVHAAKRSYNLTSIARKFDAELDFNEFDLIIGMDPQNIADLETMAKNEYELNKIKPMINYCSKFRNHNSVPDPYYGGSDGFELVLDILEDACEGLLKEIN
ncbi:low molecular weight protein-tyrosine-phosphatase [Marinifilum sp. RC60d5]|uniref:low molecular weight protein-tyrosine-phosphatase n=1 Tax=Marinifilum sp. RC60d5 TaxID=3458414 RepID=UPI00403568C1